MLTGSTTEAISKGYVAMLAEDPARSESSCKLKWRVVKR